MIVKESLVMSELCISCNFSVGRRQAVTCDVCGRKQHRLCGTGNLFTFYVFNFKRHSLRDRLSMASGAQLPTQSQMEDNVRQFREFMNQYNKLTEMCFNDCATDFTTRNILTSENSCAMNCLEKYLKMTQRISERFREHQLLSAEDPAAAMQGLAPK